MRLPLNPGIATVATRATQFAGNRSRSFTPRRTIGQTPRLQFRLRRSMTSRSRFHQRLAAFMDRIQNRFTGQQDGLPFFRSLNMALARLRRVITLASTPPSESLDPWPKRRISATEPARSASLPPTSPPSETGTARAKTRLRRSEATPPAPDTHRTTARPSRSDGSLAQGATIRPIVVPPLDLSHRSPIKPIAPLPTITRGYQYPVEERSAGEVTFERELLSPVASPTSSPQRSVPAVAPSRTIQPEQPLVRQTPTIIQRIVEQRFVVRVIYRSVVSPARSPHPPVRDTRKGGTTAPSRVTAARRESVIRAITATQLHPMPSLPTTTRIGAKPAANSAVRWLSNWLKPPVSDQARKQASALEMFQSAARTLPQTLSRPPVPIVSWLGVAPAVPSLPFLPDLASPPATAEAFPRTGTLFVAPVFSRLPALSDYRQAIPVSTPVLSGSPWTDRRATVFILPLYRRARKDAATVMEEVADAIRFFPTRSTRQETASSRTAGRQGGVADRRNRSAIVSPLLTRLEQPYSFINARVSPLLLQPVPPRPVPESPHRETETSAERSAPAVPESGHRVTGRRATRQSPTPLPSSETDAEDAERPYFVRSLTITAPFASPSLLSPAALLPLTPWLVHHLSPVRRIPERTLLRRTITATEPDVSREPAEVPISGRITIPGRITPALLPLTALQMTPDAMVAISRAIAGTALPGPEILRTQSARSRVTLGRLTLPRTRSYSDEIKAETQRESAVLPRPRRPSESVFHRGIPPLLTGRPTLFSEPPAPQRIVVSGSQPGRLDTPLDGRIGVYSPPAINNPPTRTAITLLAIKRSGLVVVPLAFTPALSALPMPLPAHVGISPPGRIGSEAARAASITFRSLARPWSRLPVLPSKPSQEEGGKRRIPSYERYRPEVAPARSMWGIGKVYISIISDTPRRVPASPVSRLPRMRIAGSIVQHIQQQTDTTGSQPVRMDAPLRRRIAVFTPLAINPTATRAFPAQPIPPRTSPRERVQRNPVPVLFLKTIPVGHSPRSGIPTRAIFSRQNNPFLTREPERHLQRNLAISPPGEPFIGAKSEVSPTKIWPERQDLSILTLQIRTNISNGMQHWEEGAPLSLLIARTLPRIRFVEQSPERVYPPVAFTSAAAPLLSVPARRDNAPVLHHAITGQREQRFVASLPYFDRQPSLPAHRDDGNNFPYQNASPAIPPSFAQVSPRTPWDIPSRSLSSERGIRPSGNLLSIAPEQIQEVGNAGTFARRMTGSSLTFVRRLGRRNIQPEPATISDTWHPVETPRQTINLHRYTELARRLSSTLDAIWQAATLPQARRSSVRLSGRGVTPVISPAAGYAPSVPSIPSGSSAPGVSLHIRLSRNLSSDRRWIGGVGQQETTPLQRRTARYDVMALSFRAASNIRIISPSLAPTRGYLATALQGRLASESLLPGLPRNRKPNDPERHDSPLIIQAAGPSVYGPGLLPASRPILTRRGNLRAISAFHSVYPDHPDQADTTLDAAAPTFGRRLPDALPIPYRFERQSTAGVDNTRQAHSESNRPNRGPLLHYATAIQSLRLATVRPIWQPDQITSGRTASLLDLVQKSEFPLPRFRTRLQRETAIRQNAPGRWLPESIATVNGYSSQAYQNPYIRPTSAPFSIVGNELATPAAYESHFVALRKRIPTLQTLSVEESATSLEPIVALLAMTQRYAEGPRSNPNRPISPSPRNLFRTPVIQRLPIRSTVTETQREAETEDLAREASTLAFVRSVGRALGDLLKWSRPTASPVGPIAYTETETGRRIGPAALSLPGAGTLLQRIARWRTDSESSLPTSAGEQEQPQALARLVPPSPVLLKTVTLAEARRNRQPGASPALLQPAPLGTSFEGDSADTSPDKAQGATSATERDEAAGVDLLAQEVWRLLKRRLATEKERGYRRPGRL